jgi:hypothetical protein
MLTIRAAQMQVFESRLRCAFEARLASFIHERCPDRCAHLGDEETSRTVTAAVSRADRYGLVSEYDIARFVLLEFLLGQEIDPHSRLAWVRETLDDPRLPPETKLDILWEYAEHAPAGDSPEELE